MGVSDNWYETVDLSRDTSWESWRVHKLLNFHITSPPHRVQWFSTFTTSTENVNHSKPHIHKMLPLATLQISADIQLQILIDTGLATMRISVSFHKLNIMSINTVFCACCYVLCLFRISLVVHPFELWCNSPCLIFCLSLIGNGSQSCTM